MTETLTSSNFDKKYKLLANVGWAAIAGATLVLGGLFASFLGRDSLASSMLLFVGGLLILPWILILNWIVLLHWKHKYRGRHSDLWGAVLLFETSGWFKLIYWLRHVRPERRGSGRYANAQQGTL